MAPHRFFLDVPLPDSPTAAWPVPLCEGDAHHLFDVLRLGRGDTIALVGSDGREAEATIVREPGGRGEDSVPLLADVSAPRERAPLPRIALAQGLAKRERMELAIQKATELGATEVLPVAFARSVVRLDAERAPKRLERWRKIAAEAAKQSQRTAVPEVHAATDLEGLVAECARFDAVLVPWEEHEGAGVGEALARLGAGPGSSVLVVIGPEGGLEEAEVARLRKAGGVPVTLGPDVLRTDTAAVVALALASYELGGMGYGGGA